MFALLRVWSPKGFARRPPLRKLEGEVKFEHNRTCRVKLADSPTPWSQSVQRGFDRSPNRARTPTEPKDETQAPTDRELSAKKARTLEISRTAEAGDPPVLGGLVAGANGTTEVRTLAASRPNLRRAGTDFPFHEAGEGIAHSHLTFSYDARSCASVLPVQVSEVTLLRSMMILRCSAD